MRQLWRKAQYLKLYAKIVKDPNRTDLIFKALDLVLSDPDQRAVKRVTAIAMSDAGFAKLYEERYMPTPPDLRDLERLPEGSFGRAVHAHMTSNGLTFDLWPRGDAGTLVDYVNKRIYFDHDLLHALLGYGTSVEDELALQGFGCAQHGSPFGAALISGGLLHLLGSEDPMRATAAIAKAAEGYEKGKRAKFLLGVRLQELLPEPLADVRARLGLFA